GDPSQSPGRLHPGPGHARPAAGRACVSVGPRSRLGLSLSLDTSGMVLLHNVLIAASLGFLAGLHTATWGIYKDSIHEGFFWPRYFRSPIVGAVMGVIAFLIA